MHVQLKQLTCNCVVSDRFMQWSIRITVYVGMVMSCWNTNAMVTITGQVEAVM